MSLERALARMRIGSSKREIFDGFIIMVRRTTLGTVADVIDPPAALTAFAPWGPDADLIPRGSMLSETLFSGDRSSYVPSAPALQEAWRPELTKLFWNSVYGPDFGAISSGYSPFRFGSLKTRGGVRSIAITCWARGGSFSTMGAALDYSGAAYLPAVNSLMPQVEESAASSSAAVVAVVAQGAWTYYPVDDGVAPDIDATPDMGLGFAVYESDVAAIAPGFGILHREADRMRGAALRVENPASARADADWRFNGDGITGDAGYTDEMLVAVPIVKQSSALDSAGAVNVDVYGEWAMYLAIARMNRANFDADDTDTWLAATWQDVFYADSLPENLRSVENTNPDWQSAVGWPVRSQNLIRQPFVQRYAGGYAVLFHRTASTPDLAAAGAVPPAYVAAQALVVLQIGSEGLVPVPTVLSYSEAQQPGHAPADDDPESYAWTMPLGSITVDEVAYFLVWRQWLGREGVGEASQVPTRGEFLLVRVDEQGASLVEVTGPAFAWQCIGRMQYAVTSGERVWLPPNAYADTSYYLTSVTSGVRVDSGYDAYLGDDGCVKDRVDQLGKRRICWLATDYSVMHGGAEPTFPVYLLAYDLDTGALTNRGKVFDSDDGKDTRFGRITVVTREVLADDGSVLQPAVLLCSVVPTLIRYSDASVLISTDGGATWAPLATDFTGRAGVLYSGNLLQVARYGDGVSFQNKVL